MITLGFQQVIFDNYKAGKETQHGKFRYFIQYNPLAETHTWIVRHDGKRWYMYQPLDKSIK